MDVTIWLAILNFSYFEEVATVTLLNKCRRHRKQNLKCFVFFITLGNLPGAVYK